MAATKFNVVLDIPLTKAQKSEIDKDIKAVVSKHLAKIDSGAVLGEKQIPKIPNKEWLGRWIKKFGSLEQLKISKTFRELKR